jgi:hypothetical protein
MADVLEFARALAEIAVTTEEPETALRLVELIDHLLTAAGLPENPTGEGSRRA